jgi:Fic family protein
MVEFFILLSAGVPSPASHLLSNHYNQTRSDYYRQLQHASSSGGDVFPFLDYAVAGFVDGLRSTIEAIRDQQWQEAWRNYVDEQFGERPSAPELRQKNLVLDLSERGDWVVTSDIPMLSPSLAASYATKQGKTVSRDVNALVGRGLIEKRGAKIRARREIILAFLPPRKQAG